MILSLCILLTCLMVVCMMILPIANLEPGVSGRNSLPLPGTLYYGALGVLRFLAPLNVCIEFCIDFRLDFGTFFGPKFAYLSMIF